MKEERRGPPTLPDTDPLVPAARPDLTIVAGWFLDIATIAKTDPEGAARRLRRLAPAVEAILNGYWGPRMAALAAKETG